MLRVKAFISTCKGNIASFPYIKLYGECPVLSFGVIKLAHSASNIDDFRGKISLMGEI
jgi:hypothetical protein